ncbi:MAG: Hsp20/alpha crystallin family protein [Candidatus Aenigmatarchaeota archaeon]
MKDDGEKPFKFFWEDDPFGELERMRDRIDGMMRNMWKSTPEFSSRLSGGFPVDVSETEDEVVIKGNLPGIDKKNISVKATDNEIEIKAEQEEEMREEDENFFRHERRYGNLQRRIQLPEEVNSDKAKAKVENGVLEVRLPKKKKSKKKGKEIEVE